MTAAQYDKLIQLAMENSLPWLFIAQTLRWAAMRAKYMTAYDDEKMMREGLMQLDEELLAEVQLVD